MPRRRSLTLAGCSNLQLDRLYATLYRKLGDGGHFGWDWVTARMVYPTITTSLWEIAEELNRRGTVPSYIPE